MDSACCADEATLEMGVGTSNLPNNSCGWGNMIPLVCSRVLVVVGEWCVRVKEEDSPLEGQERTDHRLVFMDIEETPGCLDPGGGDTAYNAWRGQ